MNKYKKPYIILFSSITKALNELEKINFGSAIEILVKAQQDAEEEYISYPNKK